MVLIVGGLILEALTILGTCAVFVAVEIADRRGKFRK